MIFKNFLFEVSNICNLQRENCIWRERGDYISSCKSDSLMNFTHDTESSVLVTFN